MFVAFTHSYFIVINSPLVFVFCFLKKYILPLFQIVQLVNSFRKVQKLFFFFSLYFLTLVLVENFQ